MSRDGLHRPERRSRERQSEISASIKRVDLARASSSSPDMFGGTPCNLALTHLKKGKVEVLAGANLPSLIKLISVRTTFPLENAVREAIEAGRKYMRAGSSELAGGS